MTKIISVTIINLETHKAGAKHELIFNNPATDDEMTQRHWLTFWRVGFWGFDVLAVDHFFLVSFFFHFTYFLIPGANPTKLFTVVIYEFS